MCCIFLLEMAAYKQSNFDSNSQYEIG